MLDADVSRSEAYASSASASGVGGGGRGVPVSGPVKRLLSMSGCGWLIN